MNSGGHIGYFDFYSDAIPQELVKAIMTVGYKEIDYNYQQALVNGKNDGRSETDNAYYQLSPSLCDCLQEYVKKTKN